MWIRHRLPVQALLSRQYLSNKLKEKLSLEKLSLQKTAERPFIILIMLRQS
ncbi:hypothetical protein XCR1_1430030 [Xenorhabdus cabanillasii JM26]|uniref:Uncharacterized protein n=1 Tax=Xenorhabdus cabanillasii JM26 TaxID=1427517 RepID=W1IQZ6_9GAMM|nr:hypothetical protein XCR1_1430030 [Xenorhabdus cabanillasii JM26]